jgi:uncharacterized protein YkwD
MDRRAMVVLAAGAAACGGVSEVGERPSWRQPPQEVRASAGEAGDALGDEPRVVTLEAADRGAAEYNAQASLPPRPSPRADAVMEALFAAVERTGVPAPARDGRLDAASQALAEVAPANAPVPYRLIEFALQHHGIVEPSPHLVVIWGPPGDTSALVDKLERRLPAILESAAFARVGVGVAERAGGELATVIALQTSYLETEPIPRVLPDGGTIRVEGRVLEPYRHPEVFVTRDDGQVIQTPLRRIGGSEFRADVTCEGRSGHQQVEIIAADHKGSTVLANFPIWCFEEPPRSVQVVIGGLDDVPASPEQAEARLHELINRDRERHGLPPLKVDARVAEVARAHALEMAETGVVAHVSPTTGSASDRVQDAGIRTPIVLENVARAYSVIEAHEGLMNSPGHRASILHEAVTHVGVGVVLGEHIAGRHELFVAQVFTRRGAPMDRQAALEAVHRSVQAIAPLEAEPGLTAVAQAFAQKLVDGVPRAQAAAEATRQLEARGVPFADVSSMVAVVSELDGFTPQRALEGSEVTHYGVGLVQADHAVMGDGAFTIVMLVGRRP